MGLRVMHHRARMIGASLEVEGKKNKGTVITCRLGSKITLKKISNRGSNVAKNGAFTSIETADARG